MLRPTLLEAQRTIPQALTFSEGVRFIAWHLRCPFLGECRQGLKHFWNHRAYVGNGPALSSHIKKGHVPYSPVHRALDKYQRLYVVLSYSAGPLSWDIIQLAMFPDMQIRSGVSWFQWQLIEAVWHGFWEADIYIMCAKISTPWASGSLSPGSNLCGVLGKYQGMYWVAACFIFVCQLNTSWDPLACKCYYDSTVKLKLKSCQKRLYFPWLSWFWISL